MRLTKKHEFYNDLFDLKHDYSECNNLYLREVVYHKDIMEAAQKLGQLEDIEEWLSKKIFYGKAANIPNKILELKFEKLDFRPGEDLLLVHFKVLNSWATNIFYSILEYGRTWSLIKEELL